MRIISQDGTLDLPYEDIGITIGHNGDSKEFYIFAHLVNSAEPKKDPQKLGTYSTEAKVQKAMDMLHKAYIGMPVVAVKDVQMDVKMVSDAIRNGFVQPMPLNEPKIECDIFKFPRDEEVEVQDEQ